MGSWCGPTPAQSQSDPGGNSRTSAIAFSGVAQLDVW